MNLSGVVCSVVHSWWASCLTASNQPGAPWQTSQCMTHRTEHTMRPFNAGAQTHTSSHIYLQGASLPNSVSGCIAKSLTSMHQREALCVSAGACARACARASMSDGVYSMSSVREEVWMGVCWFSYRANVWWGMSHPDGDPKEDWQVGDSPCINISVCVCVDVLASISLSPSPTHTLYLSLSLYIYLQFTVYCWTLGTLSVHALRVCLYVCESINEDICKHML